MTPDNLQSLENLRRTPLYALHQELGAKFVEFGGWEMPVLYAGIKQEHQAVRNSVGIFDVSHMGEISVHGEEALSFLEYLTCNKVSLLKPGRAQYSMLLNHAGGVVDDIIVYCRGRDSYLLCVNASNTDKAYRWIFSQLQELKSLVTISNDSANYAQLAIQGPKSQRLLEMLLRRTPGTLDCSSLRPFSFFEEEIAVSEQRIPSLIARTGYTGEDGFEIFCPSAKGPALWQAVMQQGREFDIAPVGLGARDTLRLEACLSLYGHELTDTLGPLHADVSWVVKFDKPQFIGREALLELQSRGVRPRLVGLEVLDKGIVRQETRLFSIGAEKQQEIGFVVSGTLCPTINKAVALAYVEPEFSAIDTELVARVREKVLGVRVTKRPFYSK